MKKTDLDRGLMFSNFLINSTRKCIDCGFKQHFQCSLHSILIENKYLTFDYSNNCVLTILYPFD